MGFAGAPEFKADNGNVTERTALTAVLRCTAALRACLALLFAAPNSRPIKIAATINNTLRLFILEAIRTARFVWRCQNDPDERTGSRGRRGWRIRSSIDGASRNSRDRRNPCAARGIIRHRAAGGFWRPVPGGEFYFRGGNHSYSTASGSQVQHEPGEEEHREDNAAYHHASLKKMLKGRHYLDDNGCQPERD